jgi:hypothetical protein
VVAPVRLCRSGYRRPSRGCRHPFTRSHSDERCGAVGRAGRDEPGGRVVDQLSGGHEWRQPWILDRPSWRAAPVVTCRREPQAPWASGSFLSALRRVANPLRTILRRHASVGRAGRWQCTYAVAKILPCRSCRRSHLGLGLGHWLVQIGSTCRVAPPGADLCQPLDRRRVLFRAGHNLVSTVSAEHVQRRGAPFQ